MEPHAILPVLDELDACSEKVLLVGRRSLLLHKLRALMMVESGAPPAEESPRPTTLRRGVSFVTESRPSDVGSSHGQGQPGGVQTDLSVELAAGAAGG